MSIYLIIIICTNPINKIKITLFLHFVAKLTEKIKYINIPIKDTQWNLVY